jgi:hypothetical protein
MKSAIWELEKRGEHAIVDKMIATAFAASPLVQQLNALRPQIAEAATRIFQEWTQDEDGFDDVYGGGGICDDVASEIQGIIATYLPDVEVRDGGWDGDDHAYTIVEANGETIVVDIPPYVYESGGGMSWEKRQDVEAISPEDVAIYSL